MDIQNCNTTQHHEESKPLVADDQLLQGPLYRHCGKRITTQTLESNGQGSVPHSATFQLCTPATLKSECRFPNMSNRATIIEPTLSELSSVKGLIHTKDWEPPMAHSNPSVNLPCLVTTPNIAYNWAEVTEGPRLRNWLGKLQSQNETALPGPTWDLREVRGPSRLTVWCHSFLQQPGAHCEPEGASGHLGLICSNTLAIWCEELTHKKGHWCWERLKAGREGDNRGWDGWMAAPTGWTWVCAISGSWWWTGKPGVLQSMGSQRIRHDWVTELNWTSKNYGILLTCWKT